jgi:hypothetical protein
MLKNILLLLIKTYQKTISPDHGIFSFWLGGKVCRFYPTCSEYAYQAIEKKGSFLGLILAIKRIGRCHPFSKGGYDPVE